MDISEAIRQRQSIRAYRKKEVSRKTIEKILDTARFAPSGANCQPWQVAAVSGTTKDKIANALIAAFRRGEPEDRDFDYYPVKWEEPFKMRRIACGMQLYETLGIERKDRQGRLRQWEANYRGFDAPVLLFFFLDPSLAIGSYMDSGMFLQSVMLAAMDEGLATCPQAALSGYATQVKNILGYPQTTILLCGMALGYEEKGALVNSYRTPREAVSTFTTFHD
ncbi:MAG: nitroreductase [Desulfopila sp.]|jgi:nitroreductase|nr:nitroreductase [Desulfopila sp.]